MATATPEAPAALGLGTRAGQPAAVVTLTPSPVADRVYYLDRLHPGRVNRAKAVEFGLGGNGVNVARALQLAGSPARAILPLAATDDPHGALLGACPGLFRRVRSAAPMRVNTVLVAGDGGTTNANQPAPPMPRRDWDELAAVAAEEVRSLGADWFVLAGALPQAEDGGPLPLEDLFAAVRAEGARVCADVRGSDLVRIVETGLVDLVKPNAAELAEAAGGPLPTLGAVLGAVRALQQRGAADVVASLGADGILGVVGTAALWAAAAPARILNTTGAGDAALAGLLAEVWDGAEGFAAGLVRAASWGAHAVAQPAAGLTTLAGAPAAALRTVDPSHPLAP